MSVVAAAEKSNMQSSTSLKNVFPFCKRSHKLSECQKFSKLSRYRRIEFIRKWGSCFKWFEKSCLIIIRMPKGVDNCSSKDDHHP